MSEPPSDCCVLVVVSIENMHVCAVGGRPPVRRHGGDRCAKSGEEPGLRQPGSGKRADVRPTARAGPGNDLSHEVAVHVADGHDDATAERRVVSEELGLEVARAIENTYMWTAAAAGGRDDLGPPVAVHVADGHVHPAAEGRVVRQEVPDVDTGPAVEDAARAGPPLDPGQSRCRPRRPRSRRPGPPTPRRGSSGRKRRTKTGPARWPGRGRGQLARLRPPAPARAAGSRSAGSGRRDVRCGDTFGAARGAAMTGFRMTGLIQATIPHGDRQALPSGNTPPGLPRSHKSSLMSRGIPL